MLSFLFSILDIPLVLMLIVLALNIMVSFKNMNYIFLGTFISLIFSIFIAGILLSQQVSLGEFMVIGIFFIFALIFFVFMLNGNFDDTRFIKNSIRTKLRTILTTITFIIVFLIVLSNFFKINTAKSVFISKEVKKIESPVNNIVSYNSYEENISLLNQNKLFQKLTHIIMFYVCLVVVLYFFNKKDDINKVEEDE